MAKITIAGDAIVVTSALKLEDIKTIAKYRPKALTLMGGEDNKEPVFAIGVTDGCGSINAVGASFGRETYDEEKLASVTMITGTAVAGNANDIKEWVADHLGSAIINLNKLEETLPAVLADIADEKQRVMNNISVAQ